MWKKNAFKLHSLTLFYYNLSKFLYYGFGRSNISKNCKVIICPDLTCCFQETFLVFLFRHIGQLGFLSSSRAKGVRGHRSQHLSWSRQCRDFQRR